MHLLIKMFAIIMLDLKFQLCYVFMLINSLGITDHSSVYLQRIYQLALPLPWM